ncbi:MAG TPA: phosphoribosylanthranilate isomerase [Campylobacterales bacterium]|nr:phosphoribosylanthranilate isomerase [Campylobacterales bacterium]
MTRVKICGITNLEDALDAIEAGADALGFVFYEKSPRFVTPEIVKEIIEKIPPFVERVGLFVNCEADEVNTIMNDCNLSLAQIHFDAIDEFYEALEVKYIKVIRAKSKEDILNSSNYRLVDAFVESYGGEGKRVNPSWFEGVDCSKIILAGGLDSGNVAKMSEFGFYGVDVSSSVEETKGKKDRIKVSNFIKEVNHGNISKSSQ